MKVETTIITIFGLIILHKYPIYCAVIALLISSIYVSARFTFVSLRFIRQGEVNERQF